MDYDYHGLIGVFKSTPQLMENYNIIREKLLRNGGASDVTLAKRGTYTSLSGLKATCYQ